jgi:hypothetical protein
MVTQMVTMSKKFWDAGARSPGGIRPRAKSQLTFLISNSELCVYVACK